MKRANYSIIAALLAVATLTGISSCSVNDNPVNGGGGEQQESSNPWVSDRDATYAKECAIVGDIESDVRNVLNKYITNTVAAPGDETAMVILSSVNDLSEEDFENAFDNDALMVLVHPKAGEVRNLFESHPEWLMAYPGDEELSGALIYAFNNRRHAHIVAEAAAKDDPVSASINRMETVDNLIASWLCSEMYYDEQMAAEEAEMADRADNETYDVKSHLYANRIAKTFTYNVRERTNKVAWSDTDYATGSLTITVLYTIYQFHVYEGRVSSGNYYLVEQSTTLANDAMFRGEQSCWHGGIRSVWMAFWCKDFSFSTELLDDQGQPANVRFIADAPPRPNTFIGSTTYTEGFDFSLTATAGVGLSTKGYGFYADVSPSFGYTSDAIRKEADYDVVSNCDDRIAAWGLVFHNNEPSYGGSVKWNAGSSQSYRGTTRLESRWIWYEADAKDNDNKNPYSIRFKARAEYGTSAFTITGATTEYHSYTEGVTEYTHKLDISTETRTYGRLNLKNDFTDKYISNIRVINYDTEEVEATISESFAPGSVAYLGSFLTKGNYVVTFMAGEERQQYVYSLNEYFKLDHLSDRTLNAVYDFDVKK